jgi:hypothetical protein
VEIDRLVPLLEIVQLLQNSDRQGDVMFFKLIDAAAVVKDDVGVEDECFFHEEGRSTTGGVPLSTTQDRGKGQPKAGTELKFPAGRYAFVIRVCSRILKSLAESLPVWNRGVMMCSI